MSDKEQIIEELKKNVKDDKEWGYLISICDEIFKKYYDGSTKAVSEFLQEKVNSLKEEFDDAYGNLLRKMGL